jgi:phenylacetate-CoA ligase
LQQLIGRTNDIAVLPSGKSAGLTFTTLQKHYRGRWKCKRIYDQANQTDTFIIKYVSDIILSQSQIEEAIALYLEPNLKECYISKKKKQARQIETV